MIAYPASLRAVGGARTGIAPVNLLDVVDVNGNAYYWSDRPIVAPRVTSPATSTPATPPPPIPLSPGQGIAWSFPQTDSFYAASSNSTVSGDLQSAQLTLTNGGITAASWSNFTIPELPSDAVIDAIIPVFFGDSNNTFNPAWDSGFGGLGTFPTHSLSMTYAASVSTSLSDLHSLYIGCNLQNSVPGIVAFGYLNVTFIGMAVYYSSASLSVEGADAQSYQSWIISVPQLTFHRSAVTDVGNFVLQNLSGDTLARDFEKLMRRSTLEGAFFVYRCWQPDAQAAWIEIHGKFTVDDVGVDTVTLKSSPAINPAEDDTPAEQYCETCQWRWSSAQCGATGTTECQYSYQTCQVPERILVVLNDYEKNYGEATANTATQVINRRRKI